MSESPPLTTARSHIGGSWVDGARTDTAFDPADLDRAIGTVELAGAEDGARVPIYFCHPLDPFEDQQEPEGLFGILYMTRIVPDRRLRQSGLEGGSVLDTALETRLSRPPLWVTARYVFLVAGGDAKRQLVALSSALQTVHDHPTLHVPVDTARRPESDEPELDTQPENEVAVAASTNTHTDSCLPAMK